MTVRIELRGVQWTGWMGSIVLSQSQTYRDRLSLDQLIRVEIASRRGPERLSVADAGDMVAIWAGVGGC
jgi:hypothetical protein